MVLVPEGNPKRSSCCPPIMEYISMTFYNPREKPVGVGEMETYLALSVYYDQVMTEPPALSQRPTMHLCSFSYHQGFLFIHSTWHYKQPLHHSLALRSEIKSNCSAAGSELSCVPPQHNVQIVHFDQMQNKIFLPRSNNCSLLQDNVY